MYIIGNFKYIIEYFAIDFISIICNFFYSLKNETDVKSEIITYFMDQMVKGEKEYVECQ